MCNPFWTGVEPGSILKVTITANTGAGVTGKLTVARGEDVLSSEKCTFPLKKRIDAGLNYIVRVDMRSTGAPATVTILSEIRDGDDDTVVETDPCQVEVPAKKAKSSRITATGAEAAEKVEAAVEEQNKEGGEE